MRKHGVNVTAMGTANSGYVQRRIVKLCEDIQVQYDGTVRDTGGNIYQLSYGENSWDPCQTVKVNGKQEVCDVSRLINRLNAEYEEEHEVEPNKVEKVESEEEKVEVVVKKKEKKPSKKLGKIKLSKA